MRQSITDDELREVFAATDDKDLLLQCGFQIPISAIYLTMKDTLITALVDCHCIVKSSVMMDQFREGLHLLDVLSMVQNYPLQMKKFFVDKNNVMSAGSQTYFYMNVTGLLLSSYRCID